MAIFRKTRCLGSWYAKQPDWFSSILYIFIFLLIFSCGHRLVMVKRRWWKKKADANQLVGPRHMKKHRYFNPRWAHAASLGISSSYFAFVCGAFSCFLLGNAFGRLPDIFQVLEGSKRVSWRDFSAAHLNLNLNSSAAAAAAAVGAVPVDDKSTDWDGRPTGDGHGRIDLLTGPNHSR